MVSSIKAIDMHAPLWARMNYLLEDSKIPQALLWVGPRHAQILSFAHRFIAIALCKNPKKPCGDCQSCRLLMQGTHPDIHEITQEPPGSAIKIEQVRGLQQDVYHRPQCSKYRFVLIYPADQLNRQAANALLKILEEPPSHVVFILIAEHAGALPLTIISRCQRTDFSLPAELHQVTSQPDYLMLGQHYPEASSRRVLFDQKDLMIRTFCDFLEKKKNVCQIASDWNQYALEDVLWFMYLLTATLIVRQLTQSVSWADSVLASWGLHTPQPVHFYTQLDTILAFMKKNNQNIPLNQTLVLETVLMGYL